jgi:hypothetical protein
MWIGSSSIWLSWFEAGADFGPTRSRLGGRLDAEMEAAKGAV